MAIERVPSEAGRPLSFKEACQICRTMDGCHVTRHSVYPQSFTINRNKGRTK